MHLTNSPFSLNSKSSSSTLSAKPYYTVMIDSVIMAYINDVFEDGFHSVDLVGIFVWPVKSESKGLIWLLLFFVADVSNVFGWRG